MFTLLTQFPNKTRPAAGIQKDLTANQQDALTVLTLSGRSNTGPSPVQSYLMPSANDPYYAGIRTDSYGADWNTVHVKDIEKAITDFEEAMERK